MDTSTKGSYAARRLDDEVFSLAVAEIAQEIFDGWALSKTTQEREDMFKDKVALERVVGKLHSYVQNANYEKEIDDGEQGL